MKSLIQLTALSLLIVASSLMWTNAAALSSIADDKVKSTFNRMFPKAKNVAWESNDEGNLVAYFVTRDGDKEVHFQPGGQWLHTFTNVEGRDLPVDIINYLDDQYNGATIYESKTYEDPETPLAYKIVIALEEDQKEELTWEEDELVVVTESEVSDWLIYLELTFNGESEMISVKRIED
ncbi:MAG: hypothetical protein R8G66_11740 [Cytophagales bacterium]|nr:hypothetical protein [Cytophagales bacterium]